MAPSCTGRRIAAIQRVLSDIYPDWPSVARILDEARIDRGVLAANTSIVNIWHSAIREACLAGQLIDLLGIVQAEYPQHQDLRRVIQEYEQAEEEDSLRSAGEIGRTRWIGDAPTPIRNFVGRADYKAWIVGLLDESGDRKPLTIVVHGMPGVGKTQMIRAVLDEEAQRFDTILWIQGETEAQIIASLARVAVDIGIEHAAEMEAVQAARASMEWIQRSERIAVVFDSGTPRSVRRFLPLSGDCVVFVSSNSPDWRGLVTHTTALAPLDRQESIDFLLRRTGQKDQGAAQEIASELGDLPIALEQAGAYIEQADVTLGKYESLLQSSIQDLMDVPSPAVDYPQSFSAALRLSTTRAQERDPRVMDLLLFVAQLGDSPIPREIVCDGLAFRSASMGVELSEVESNSLIAVARSYSLIMTTPELIQMHPLVAKWMRTCIDRPQELEWAHFVLKFLSYKLPLERESSEDWWLYREMASHVIELSRNIDTAALGDADVFGAIEHTAAHLSNMGQFDDAYKLSKMIVEYTRGQFGVGSVEYAKALNNSCYSAEMMGFREEAETSLVQAMEILQGRGDLDEDGLLLLGVIYSNRAQQMMRQGNLDSAEDLLERAREIHSGRDDKGAETAAAIDLNNLATIYRERGEYGRARESFEEVVRCHRKNLSGNDARLSVALLNQAGMESVLGNKSEAEALLDEAVAIDDKIFGEIYLPDRIQALAGLAALLFGKGEYSRAVKLYDRVLRIVETSPIALDDEFIAMVTAGRADAYREMMRTARKAVAPTTILTNTEDAFSEAIAIQRVLRKLGLPVRLRGFEDSSF